MYCERLNISFPKYFPFAITKGRYSNNNENTLNNLHYHNFVEICHFIDGYGKIRCMNGLCNIQPGDIFVFNNMEKHSMDAYGDFNIVLLQFSPGFIYLDGSFEPEYMKVFCCKEMVDTNRIASDEPYSREISGVIMEISREWSNREEGYKMVVKSLLAKILVLLLRHYRLCEKTRGRADETFLRSFNRIKNVLEYINENFHREISLDKLAGIANIHKNYLCTCFHNVMNMSLFDYVIKLRINMCCSLLLETDKPITEISQECGFNTISHFNVQFRKIHGMTPGKYRKQNSGKSPGQLLQLEDETV